MSKKRSSLGDEIRAAVNSSGMSRNQICKAGGIDPAIMSRFMAGTVGMQLSRLEAVADVLDLHIIVGTAKTTDGKSKQAKRKTR
jgi:transcriptional regulator with XRE-family HTH domain